MLAIRMERETQIRACREVPPLRVVPKGHWEVQTYTLCDGWVNCWTVSEGDAEPQAETFTTRDEATKALRDYIADCILAVQDGDMSDAPTFEDHRIVFVEA